MPQRLLPSVLLSASIALAGCVGALPLGPGQTLQPSVVARTVAAAVLKGTLSAPANVINMNGGTVINMNGGSVINMNGGTALSDGGLVYQVTQVPARNRPLADAEVFLADATGQPIAGTPVVRTDAQGSYTLPRVPVGTTFVVVARFTTLKGNVGVLKTIAQARAGTTTADIDAATTLVTARTTMGKEGVLGDFSDATFLAAVEGMRKALAAEGDKLPNWASQEDVNAWLRVKIEQLEAKDQAHDQQLEDLAGKLDALNAEFERMKDQAKTTAQLEEELQVLKDQQGGALAASPPAPPPPSAEPFRQPQDFVGGDSATAGGWSYGHLPIAVADPTRVAPNVWDASRRWWIAPADKGEGSLLTLYKGSTDPLLLLLHPGEFNDAVLSWKAPAAGTIDVKAIFEGQARITADGVGVHMVYLSKNEAGEMETVPLGEAFTLTDTNRWVERSMKGIEVDPALPGSVYVRVNKKTSAAHDTIGARITIEFTPR